MAKTDEKQVTEEKSSGSGETDFNIDGTNDPVPEDSSDDLLNC